MSKRNRNDEEEDIEQTKKFFSTTPKYNLNPQSNKKNENQMDICYDSSNETEMTDATTNTNKSAKVVVVKESHSSEILSMDFYPGLHRYITNKIGW